MHAGQTPMHIKLKKKTLDNDRQIYKKYLYFPCTVFVSTATILLLCWLNKVTYQQPVSQGFFYLQVLDLQSYFSSHNCSLENCRSLFSMACSKGTGTVLVVVRFPVCTLGFSLSPKIILDIASHSFSDMMSLPQAHKQIRTEE